MRKNISGKSLFAASFIFVSIFFAMIFAAPAYAALKAVGPVDASTGFPLWYQDTNNVAIELCKDPSSALCLADTVIAGNAESERIGFGAEAFWWTTEVLMGTRRADGTAGKALLVLAQEAAFLNGDPAPGDQMSFGRLRMFIDVPVAGRYKITHPFGVAVFDVSAERIAATNGIRAINANLLSASGFNAGQSTNDKLGDIGCAAAPCDFSLALGSGIGPFLKWDPNVAPAAPAGYLGDAVSEHKITGSPFGTNIFRIEGPSGSNLDGAGNNVVQTDLFAVSGKIFSGPTVMNISSTNAGGFYKAGDVITITMKFSAPVVVTGTPLLTLETGATDRTASFAGGSGTSTLTFTYNVQGGDSSDDLDYASANALALNGGTINDVTLGTAALLGLFPPGSAGSLGANKNIIIDITPPSLAGSNPVNGASVPALDKIVFTLSDNAKTEPSGTTITATKDGSAFTAFTRDNTVSNTVTVLIASPADGTYAFTVTPKDKAGNMGTPSTITVTGNSNIPAAVNVSAANPDGPYGVGKEINILIPMTRAVNVTGTPALLLETGTTNRHANYASGSGTNTLTFIYTVQPGDSSGDLDYVGTDSLALNSGTIINSATGDAAFLTLPAPGAAGSLGANKVIIIDTVMPMISMPSHAGLTDSSAVITWTSDKPSNSVVKYGTSAAGATAEKADSAMTTAHLVQLAGLSASTGYTYNVTSCDAGGNCATSDPHLFVTAAAPPAQPAPAASPAPSGGGGAAPSTQASSAAPTGAFVLSVPTRTATFYHNIDIMRHGPDADVHGSVTKVTLNLKKAVVNPLVSIGLVDVLPVPKPETPVFTFFDFRKENFGNEDIESAVVEIKMHKHWLAENNITAVYLSRYDNGWKKIRTEQAGEDAEYKIYNAYVDGFSYFAIAVEKVQAQPAAQQPAQQEQPVAEQQIQQLEQQPAYGIDTTMLVGIIILLIVIGGVGYYLYGMAGKKKEK